MRFLTTILGLLLCACGVSAAPMTFVLSGTGGNCAGCEWTAAQGEITPQTPQDFLNYLHGLGFTGTEVVFNSPGGNLLAGIKLGELIRKTGSSTAIGKTVNDTSVTFQPVQMQEPGICASACAFAFLGGKERYLDQNSRLGVHQFSFPKDVSASAEGTESIVGLTLAYALEMGIDPRVIAAASGTSPDNMHWFTPEEIATYRLDNSKSYQDPWQLEPYHAGMIVTTTYHQNADQTVAVTLLCSQEDHVWRLLLSQQDANSASQLVSGQIFSFAGSYQTNPTLKIGQRAYGIEARDVEYQAVSGDLIHLSLYLPQFSASDGGQHLTFSPDLARVYGNLLWTKVALPPVNWLALVGRNCV